MYKLTDIKVIKDLCSRHGFTFSKTLGQNFLTDEDTLIFMAQLAARRADCALEIGPGFGTLTCAIGQTMKKVVSLEVDESLKPALAETVAGFPNVDILWRDIMKTDVSALIKERFGDERVCVCANLPYYITTPIITHLLENCGAFSSVIVMVQKEVAQRLCAKPGSKECGALTYFTSYHADCSIARIVEAEKFFPRPKVDSAVVVLDMLLKPRVHVSNEDFFFKVIRTSFSQRRKTLRNTLLNAKIAPREVIDGAIRYIDVREDVRGERLSLEEFARLSDYLERNI
ncbi:MAG: 16S rRNA (adenine(1518)-N(6)/adenine(1519)-N(6))-dimethyltransferase RsmA [Clostridia bacterium]|nr:16S rRNA (adenine(1518)-N(6)/adenine(1519)-N(6))-dimethyltransferase RsmA [Clostridia bacterium]